MENSGLSLSANAAVPPEQRRSAIASYDNKVSYVAPNGKEIPYYHIPGRSKQFDAEMDPKVAFLYFKRRMPPSDFKEFLTDCFGSTQLGMSLLLDSLACVDEDGTMLRQVLLDKQLSTQPPRKYTIEQGLTLKSLIGLTARVCFFNNVFRLSFSVLHRLL